MLLHPCEMIECCLLVRSIVLLHNFASDPQPSPILIHNDEHASWIEHFTVAGRPCTTLHVQILHDETSHDQVRVLSLM